MSKMCGDTARFHRIRKQRNRRRADIHKLRTEIDARKTAATVSPKRPTP
jgi:hypothetical protein